MHYKRLILILILLINISCNYSFQTKFKRLNKLNNFSKKNLNNNDDNNEIEVGKKLTYAISVPHYVAGAAGDAAIRRKSRSRGGRGWKKIQKNNQKSSFANDNNTSNTNDNPDTNINSKIGRCSVYCVGDKIDINALRIHIFKTSFGDDSHLKLDASSSDDADDEVLHVSNKMNNYFLEKESDLYVISEKDKEKENLNKLMKVKDIFYFEYGVVVFWNLDPLEEKAALKELQTCRMIIDPVKPADFTQAYDVLDFTFDSKMKKVVKFDKLNIRSLLVEEKLAYSYAMAQSSKLFIFESKVQRRLEKTKHLPKELALNGRISAGKLQLHTLIGELFVEQTEVNLFSSILDTPDFLWEDDEQTPAYESLRSYLEVNARVEILNTRLNVIKELLSILTSQVGDRQSTRLEWIIIWLIAIEIVLGIASSPLIAGLRTPVKLLATFAVPVGILGYRKWGDK